ncbi:MAG: DUF3078 domain-containing protein [Rhodothermales bacterium]|nr:DUF3078 domain-containing protein [Rhodothermales bacterium]
MRTTVKTLLLFFVTTMVVSSLSVAQDADTLAWNTWHKNATASLSGSQVGFDNWQGGGINSVSVTAGASGSAQRISQRWKQTHEGRIGLGVVKQDTLDFRKAEDIIFLSTTTQWLGDGFFAQWNPTFNATVRTQFAEGYNYNSDPIDGTRATPVKVSAIFSPGYISESIGLTHDRGWISQRFGLAAKQNIVTIERFRPLYGNVDNETVRFEAGLESFTRLKKELVTNVFLQSSLGVFASFQDIGNPDLIFENLVTMKVNEWLNVNFEVVTIYDYDVSDNLQLKEVFSIGASIILI